MATENTPAPIRTVEDSPNGGPFWQWVQTPLSSSGALILEMDEGLSVPDFEIPLKTKADALRLVAFIEQLLKQTTDKNRAHWKAEIDRYVQCIEFPVR